MYTYVRNVGDLPTAFSGLMITIENCLDINLEDTTGANVSEAPHGRYIWDFWIYVLLWTYIRPTVEYCVCVRPKYKVHFYKANAHAIDLDKKEKRL